MSTPKQPDTISSEQIRALLKEWPAGLTVRAMAIKLNATMRAASILASKVASMKDLYAEGTSKSRNRVWKIKPPEPKASPIQAPKQAIPLPQAHLPLEAILATFVANEVEKAIPGILREVDARIAKALATWVIPTVEANVPEWADGVMLSKVEVPKKPRITIVGLLPDQKGFIEREFPGLDTHFVGSDDVTSGRLKSLSATSEGVIVMTDFVSHQTEDVIRKAHGNLIRCSGGMSSLRGILGRPSLAQGYVDSAPLVE